MTDRKKNFFETWHEIDGKKYGIEMRWGNIMLAIIIACMMINNVSTIYWTNYNQGIPKTHQGSVIYVSHKYSKWNDFQYTDIEILTYSGDTHHAYFWGHVDFEIGVNYKIYTVIEIRRMRMFPYGMSRMERVVALEVLGEF